MRKCLLVLLMIITVCATALTPDISAANEAKIGFTIIPTKIISDESDVELRCGISNISAGTEVVIDFLADGIVQKSVTQKVNSKGYILSEYWWDTKGKKGCHVLGIRVKKGNDILDQKYHMIQVLDLSTPGPKMSTVAWEEPLAYKDGTYRAKRAIKKQDVIDNVEDMYNLGIDSIVFIYSEYIQLNTGAFYDSDLPELNNVPFPKPLNFDLLGTMLEACEARGMNVFVGSGRGRDLFIPKNEPEFSKGVDLAVKVMNEIYQKYGHYKSFYGWYMSHEPGALFDTGNGDLVFYDAIIRKIRHQWPDKAVIVGPTGTPEMVESGMRNTEIDIFAFQDAVGPGYIPGKYTWNPENRIKMLDDVFSSYKKMTDKIGKHLWSDFETWQMDGPDYAHAYPAEWSRVERQLDIEKKYVSCNSMYAYTGFLSSPASTVQIGGDKAVKLYNEYKAFADNYTAENGITNHKISTQKVNIVMKSLDNLAANMPQKIEVQTSHCNKKILVDVRWKTPNISDDEASVKGVVVTEGFPSANITAIVKKGTPPPTSDGNDGGGQITDPGTNENENPNQNLEEEQISDQSSEYVLENIESSEYDSVEGNSQNPKRGIPLWTIVLIIVVVLAGGGGAAFYFLKIKKTKTEEEKR